MLIKGKNKNDFLFLIYNKNYDHNIMKNVKTFNEYISEKKLWMQGVNKEIEEKGTKGALRKSLGKKKGQKISEKELTSGINKLKKKKHLTPSEKKKEKRMVLAETFRKSKKK